MTIDSIQLKGKLLRVSSVILTIVILSLLSYSRLFRLFSPPHVQAATSTYTTRIDWEGGTQSGTETDTKEGDLKIEADGTWGARNWHTPPLTLGPGSMYVLNGADIYMSRGYGDVYFWKYSTTNDDWAELSDMPHGSYYGADMTVLGDYIYVVFGSYQNSFARYSITSNSWETLTDVPGYVYQGGSITTDGTDLYITRGGNTQDFYKYDVSASSWSTLTGPPAYIGNAGDLVYDSGYLYTLRGANTTTFYRYDISGNSWSTMTATPATVRYNGGGVYNSTDGNIYFFRGNGQRHFWKYNVSGNSFLGPLDSPVTLATGSDLVYYSGYLYAPRGANTTTFYRYSISGNSWESRADTSASFNDDTKGIVAGSYLYFYRGGNTTEFYRYDPSGNSWSTMAVTPASVRFGGSLAYNGSGDYIYGTRGSTTLSFWRYSISGDSWDDNSVADLPADAEASYGARMFSDGTDIYYTPGIGISRMFKYDVSADSWSELANLPFAPFYGTDLAYNNGKVLAISGWYETDFWEYTLSSDTWRRLPSIAGNYGQNRGTYNGASIEWDGSSSYYITRGTNLYDLLTYTPGSNNYPTSATWTSGSLDLTYVSSWTSLTDSTTTPGDSSITYQTRSSSDNSTWTSWQTVSGGTISSTAQRYLQVKATLNATTDQTQASTLHSITLTYTGDENAPSNPTTITGSSQEIGGTSLTSGQTYSYTQPYFSWSGASDNETSVAGYYVYFGTSSSADPETVGNYQTGTSYTVTTVLSTGTYYLRVKTKDALGNISSSTTAFTYGYNGVSPSSTLLIDETVEFDGTASNVAVSSNEIKLASKAGFWLQERLSNTPAGMQWGAKSTAYVSSTNKLYVFRGANSTNFYEYDVSSDTWSSLAAAPATVRRGGGVVEGPSGYLYGFRGETTSSFWRYDISADSWSDENAADAPLTVYYGGSLIYDGSRYIYALRGYNDDVFWRYDTQTDTWESMATIDFGSPTNTVNNNAYVGADLAYDSSNTVYAIQGYLRPGFSSYDISSNGWTNLVDLPALPYQGASIEYDATNNAIYYVPGYAKPHMFKYNISSETWSQVADAPYTINYGATLRKIGNYLYLIRGGNSTSFYKYNVTKDSWVVPTRGLFGTEFQGTSYENVFYGADIIKGDGNYLYMMRGYYGNDFVRYDVSNGNTVKMAKLPVGTYNGASLVYESTNNKIYLTGGAYVQKFYEYDIATDAWTEMSSDAPLANVNYGSSMAYDGSQYIYMNRGGNSTTFYSYDTQAVAGSRWATLSVAPGGLGYGAQLVLNGGYIYTLRGQNVANNPFYRYDISADSWSDPAVSDLGIDVYNDGFMVDGSDGYLYAARGENDTEFYRYSLSGDTWTSLVDVPANVNEGGSAARGNSAKIFVLPGSGSNTYADGLYTYVMQTNTSSFEESGTYTSSVHDLTSVYKWANLQITYTSATNATISIQTRSSTDNSTWSSWTAVSQEKQIGTAYTYKISSPVRRYIQVKFSLASSDGIYSGVMSDYTINYYQDTTAPTNPTDAGLNSYSDSGMGTTVTTSTWYSHDSPYFVWPTAEATNGASDGSGGSGIAGYYVYLGTSNTADPETAGTYQTGVTYTASSLISGSTYYLRIKAKDDAGNVTNSTWAPFTYKYDASGPDAPTDLTADPSGYSATDSFDFSWTASSVTGASVSQYCYKTGASSGDYASDQCTSQTSIASIPSYQTGANTFYVRAKDEAGNYSSYATVSYYYSSSAPSPPQNLTATPSSNTSNSFAFSWDAPSTYYGAETNLVYHYSVNALPTAVNITVANSASLVAGSFATLPGANTMYVVAKDEAGNIDYNLYASATFTANTSAPGIPLNIDIADVSVKSTSSWKLAVSWEAPTDTGSGVNNYAVHRSVDGTTYSEVATTGGISYVDTGLTQQTYYYKVKACDSTNNCGSFSSAVSLYPDGKFTSPADLTANPTVSSITTKKATISWSTDRTSDSKIQFGTTTGVYNSEEVSNSTHVTSHSLKLTNLSAGTTYYFKARWTDEDGNTGTSDEYTFTTDPAPTVKDVTVSNIGLSSAILSYTSTGASKVKIYYGSTTAFGGTLEVTTATTESSYTTQLKNLDDGIKYFYKINVFDTEGEEYEGTILDFTTLPRPKVSNVKIQQVKGTAQPTVLITWTSNTEISSIATYYPTNNPTVARDEVNVTLQKGMHKMVIRSLSPNTPYTMIVKGRDRMGNEAISGNLSFTTATDTRPPQITSLKVEGTIVPAVSTSGQEQLAQLVVSWTTDEAATSQIEFGEGTGSVYSQKTQRDNNMTFNHLVVISNLSSSKVYHLRALSLDEIGNQAMSVDTVTITPKAMDNALDLVISNLQQAFGFLGKI